MEVSSISASNESYLQKLLEKKVQEENSAASESTAPIASDPVDTTQTENYDILELSGNSVSRANMALLGSDSGNYDSVDISEDGSAQSGAAQALTAGSTDQAADSESTEVDETLSLCSEEQLKKLLEAGDITQAEYNTEIARREAEEAQQESLDSASDDSAVSAYLD